MNQLAGILRAAADNYDPNKGWSSLAQPMRGLDAQDYHMLATEALPAFTKRIDDFFDKNGLSTLRIPHDAFEEFEAGNTKWDKWLKSYAANNKLNLHVDVLIVSECVKPLKSGQRKEQTKTGTSDRTKDWLRVLIIPNAIGCSKKARLDKLGNLIFAIESDEDTVARKNQFNWPKPNGYSGHKSAWVINPPSDNLLAEFPILAEIKIEDYEQQDAHSLTRKMLGLDRASKGVLPIFFNRCGDNGKNSAANYSRVSNIGKLTEKACKVIYDTLTAENGYDRFLNPKIAHNFERPSLRDLCAAIRALPGDTVSKIIDSGVLKPRITQALDYVHRI